MRPVIGLLLVFAGVTIGYLTLTGKLPPQSTPAPATGTGGGILDRVVPTRSYATRQFIIGESYR